MFDQMNGHPVRVVHPRRSFPFATVVGEVNLMYEFAKEPQSVFLTLRIGFGNDPINDRPRLRFGHVSNQTDDAALATMVNPPHRNPSATLLLDRSLLIPT